MGDSTYHEYRVSSEAGAGLSVHVTTIPEPKSTDVLVKVHAVALNNLDVMVVQGRYAGQKNGVVPCSDMAGEVIAVGDEVKTWKAGDRVCANLSLNHLQGPFTEEYKASFSGFLVDGVLAEYKTFPGHSLVRIPDYLSYQEASTLPCTAVTAWNCFQGPVPLKAGDTVLIQGTGGVSLIAIQLAAAIGAVVIATSSSDEKLRVAQRLGASHVINYREHPEWSQEVLKITGGKGVDHVVDIGGAGTLVQSLKSVRCGGHIQAVGFVAQGNATEIMDLPFLLVSKAVTLRGVLIGSRTQFEELNRMLAVSEIRPIIDRVFGFEEVQEAFAYLEKQQHVGKIVIQVSK